MAAAASVREARAELESCSIVGDSHQRIYDRRSSLSKVSIERGRSKRLRINYRTTHEILRWLLAVLGEGDFDDLDTGTDAQDRAGYHSFLDGAPPSVNGFDTAAEMAAGLADQVARRITDGVEPSEIGVQRGPRAPSPWSRRRCVTPASAASGARSGEFLKLGEGVAIGTMHRMKGLEYRCMAVVGVSADQVPSPSALAAVAGDVTEVGLEAPSVSAALLYVACTRAREDLWVGYSGEPSPFLGASAASA